MSESEEEEEEEEEDTDEALCGIVESNMITQSTT
jgi:hypothetical protein